MSRSYLFVPSTDFRKMEKAIHSVADAVIFDLEDAVESNQKQKGRESLRTFLKGNEIQKKVIVRINSPRTEDGKKDLTLLTYLPVDAIMLPKINDVNDLMFVKEKIQELGVDPVPEMIPIIETVSGIENIHGILSAPFKEVKRVAFGAIDFSLDMGISKPDPILLNHVRIQLALASRIHGKAKPIDSVFPDIKKTDELEKEALTAKGLGFHGKLAIHPSQLDVINSVFSVTETELSEAKEIVEKFEDALQKGIASIKINGKMVDYPVYKNALEVLKNITSEA